MERTIHLICALVMLVAAGCSTPDAPPDLINPTVIDPGQEMRAKAEEAYGPSAMEGGEFWPGSHPEQSPITAAVWTREGRLAIGYADGVVLRLEPDGRRAEQLSFSAPIQQFSPDGQLGLVATKPPTLLHLTDGDVLVNLVHMGSVEGSAFTVDGGLWFVADNTNTIHVWTRKRLMAPRTGEDIRDVLQREQPDYSAAFASVQSPLVGAGKAQLMFGDNTGTIHRWDTTVQELLPMVRLPGAIQSIATHADLMAVTSDAGQMRLLVQSRNVIVPWSYEATGAWVALIDDVEPAVAVVDSGVLALRDSSTGKLRWSRSIPKGTACGVYARQIGRPMALCSGAVVALLDPTDGTLQSTVQNRGGSLLWLDSNGAPIALRRDL
ncbi:MAG: WD40 repeat domain-containing protein [Myxococcota bacterium]